MARLGVEYDHAFKLFAAGNKSNVIFLFHLHIFRFDVVYEFGHLRVNG